jgi:NADH-quinone oxidoreductase subunit G
VAKLCGLDTGVLTSPMAFRQLVAAVPFYAGLTLEEIGGQGVRWPERPEAATLTPGAPEANRQETYSAAPPPSASNGHLRLGTYRPIWASPEVEISPALKFLFPAQRLELSLADAERLGIADGESVQVSQNGTRLNATAAVRSGVTEGTAFLADGIASDSANALTEPEIEVRKS